MRTILWASLFILIGCDHQKAKNNQNQSQELSAKTCTTYSSVRDIIDTNCTTCHNSASQNAISFENLGDDPRYPEIADSIMRFLQSNEMREPHKPLSEISLRKLKSWQSHTYPRDNQDCDELQQTLKKLNGR